MSTDSSLKAHTVLRVRQKNPQTPGQRRASARKRRRQAERRAADAREAQRLGVSVMGLKKLQHDNCREQQCESTAGGSSAVLPGTFLDGHRREPSRRYR